MTEAMKYDGEKVRLDLLPVEPIIDIGKVLTYGARKYSERNWEKGLAWSRCYAAALRHLLAWQNSETNDPETGLNHLAHAACEILFLLEFSRTHNELDDRPGTLNPSRRLLPGPEAEQPKTLLDVVRMTMPHVNAVDDGCPWTSKYAEAFRSAGYKQPESFDCIADDGTDIIGCKACWSRPAEKLAPEKPTHESPEPEKPAASESEKTWIDCVREFNTAFGIKTPAPYLRAAGIQKKLIDEEFGELNDAYAEWKVAPERTPRDDNARKDLLDAICDSIYVLIGLALKMGFDLDGAFAEVHRSNMSKLGADGEPILREDGKILKGPNFEAPDLTPFL